MRQLTLALFAILVSATTMSCADDSPADTIRALESARLARLEEIQRDRAAVLEQIASQGRLVDYLQTWAESETDRRVRARPLRGVDSAYLDGLQKRREAMLARIANFPASAGGAIVKGDALNRLLQVCGPTASSRLRMRQSGAPSILNGEGVGEEARVIYSRLSETPMPEISLADIQYRRGVSGPKLTGRLDGTVLNTDWPLKLRENVYQSKCKAIEQARDQGLKELSSGRPVSPKTAAELMVAVERLRSQVCRDSDRNLHHFRDYEKFRHFKIAELHMDVLMKGTARFINATKPEHVRIDVFQGETLEQFLAYMHENSIQFEQAGPNAHITYGKMFQSMLAWYVDMQLLELAVSNEQKELDSLEQRDRQLTELDAAIRSRETPAIVGAIQSIAESMFEPGVQIVIP